MSTYTSIGFERNNHKEYAFGHNGPDDHAVYLAKANQTIDIMSKIMKRSIENGTPSFSDCLKIASGSRRKIAQTIEKRNKALEGKTYHEESCEFGLSRLEENPNLYHLFLAGVYCPTSRAVARTITQSLSKSAAFYAFLQTELQVDFTPDHILEHTPEGNPPKFHLDIEWEFVSKEMAKESCFSLIEILRHQPEFVERFNKFKQKAIAEQSFSLIVSEGKKLAELSQEIVRIFRQDNPELYEKNWNLNLINTFNAKLPPPAVQTINTYAIGKLQYHFEGSDAKVLTKYISHIPYSEGDSIETILSNIEHRHAILLGHQDVTDIQSTLEDVNRLYNEAMNWTLEKGVDSLKDTVGSMMFLLAHNHRDTRGTAAESEWIEHSVYLAHNFLICSEPTRMPDLIAFSHFTLEGFLIAYKESFVLQTI